MQLIRRNRSIYETINRHRPYQYPLLIWHEGNILREHQQYIRKTESNRDVRFLDVSPLFRPPDWVAGGLPEHWPMGYRLMCRFHTYHIWQYTLAFDYVMRLDEDCNLQSAGIDPIEWLKSTSADFAAATFVGETHALTNDTLPTFVQSYMDLLYPPGARMKNLYNHIFPYTNLYVARTAFWLQPEIQRFLYAVISEPDSIRFRWGDLPVLGIVLNAFARPEGVANIPDLVYRHASHHVTVVSHV
jgi:hypothetical protein